MIISQVDYDQKPLAIRHGALLLWGTLVDTFRQGNIACQLYHFRDFFAMVYQTPQRQVIHIATFPTALATRG